MADVQPLRTLRYEPDVAGPLEDLIAPPYDVIDDEGRARAGRAERPQRRRARPPERATRHAAETLDEWRRGGCSRPGGRARHLGAPAGLHGAGRQRLARARGSSHACAWRTTARVGSGRTSAPIRARRRTGSDSRARRGRTSPPSSASSPMPAARPTETLGQAMAGSRSPRRPTDEGTRNTLWRVADPEQIAALQAALARRRAADRGRAPPLRDRARVRRRGRRRGRPPLRADVAGGARRPGPARSSPPTGC